MHVSVASVPSGSPLTTGVARSAVVASVVVDECGSERRRVLMPRVETQLAVRIGPAARGGVDVAAVGAGRRVHRKVVRGQRTLIARLRLGASEAVLGVRASEIAGRTVMLEELWGDAAARRLGDRLASARSGADAVAILGEAIAERAARAGRPASAPRVVVAAAERLVGANVGEVADELGVSPRTLRRVFQDHVGVSPKAFAQIARFHRALAAARVAPGWASVAAEAGYYDQAHLIAEFRAIAGVTPRALLAELAEEASTAPPRDVFLRE